MSLKLSTKKMMLMALFAAISIILVRFLSFYLPIFGSTTVRIGLGSIPLFLAGLLLGPLAGAITGIVADVLGTTLFSGMYFPGFTLSAALAGFIPGLLRSKLKGELTFLHTLFILGISELITSLGLNTLWVCILYHIPYLTMFVPRVIVALPLTLVYTWITYALYRRLKRELI